MEAKKEFTKKNTNKLGGGEVSDNIHIQPKL